MTRRRKRCALYTRKSSEEGLDQAFNSLDAQREACAAYVKSQASEGWKTLQARYDDGGHSGGSMERPALKRLLADIAQSQIDVVVVYKIDRLTRSLADFARMVELFERHAVSFVSVTQAFNTTSSMGRLTLNVLLSFAQFEREVTGERIRDKIAASKARGMWMGGTLPLGYDPPTPGSRALVVNEAEAVIVRHVFADYLELGSVHALMRRLDAEGIRSKQRTTKSGKVIGGHSFSRGALFYLLRNRIYLGEIVHKGDIHPGQHDAIVDTETFTAVQTKLDGNARRHAARRDPVARAPLTGRVFDADGQPMSPTFSYGRRGTPYRYYVSAPLQQGQKLPTNPAAIRRVSARDLEGFIASTLQRLAPTLNREPLDIVTRIEIKPTALHLILPAHHLASQACHLADGEKIETDSNEPSLRRLILPVRLRLRSGRVTIVPGTIPGNRVDPALIRALRKAHALVPHDAHGLPVVEAAPTSPYRRRLIRLAFLAPDLQKMILDGQQPPTLTLRRLLSDPLPLDWSDQRAALSRNHPVPAPATTAVR